jgi:ubiquinone/menaquinone biosynthesis C-methylase UbiE
LKHILHVGCGGSELPFYLRHCVETRLDINQDVNPDIVADMRSLPDGIGPFDAVFSSHSLEHLPLWGARQALAGFLRVLKPGGVVIIYVPDLEGVKPDHTTVLYEAASGPVTGHDMHYGYGSRFPDLPYMQHLSGFTAQSLADLLREAGFTEVKTERLSGPLAYNLFGFGVRPVEVSNGTEEKGQGDSLPADVPA